MTASVRTGWIAPDKYDRINEQQFRNEMEKRDLQTHKKGAHLDLGGNTFYIVLTSPNGTRYALSVSNAGAAVFTAL